MEPNLAKAEAGQSSGDNAAGAATDSLNNPGREQTFDERLDGASNPADVLRLIEEAKEGKAAPAEKEEKSPTTEQTAETTTAEGGEAEKPETKPDGESKPEGEDNGTTEETTDGKKEDEGVSDGDEGKLPERIRLKGWSDVEKLAMQLKRDDPTLTLAEAEKRAKIAKGIKDEVATENKTDTPQLPQTIAEVEAKLAELKAARSKARAEDLDFKEADRLDNEIDALKEHKLSLREASKQKETEAQAQYNAAFDASEKKAAELYEFVKQPESAAFKRMAEIDRQLEQGKDPLFNDPDKPRIIAQMAARELAIAPKSPTAKSPTAKTVTTAKKNVPPVASGNSRTSTTTTQGDAFNKQIEQAKTPEDLEKLLAQMSKR